MDEDSVLFFAKLAAFDPPASLRAKRCVQEAVREALLSGGETMVKSLVDGRDICAPPTKLLWTNST